MDCKVENLEKKTKKPKKRKTVSPMHIGRRRNDISIEDISEARFGQRGRKMSHITISDDDSAPTAPSWRSMSEEEEEEPWVAVQRTMVETTAYWADQAWRTVQWQVITSMGTQKKMPDNNYNNYNSNEESYTIHNNAQQYSHNNNNYNNYNNNEEGYNIYNNAQQYSHNNNNYNSNEGIYNNAQYSHNNYNEQDDTNNNYNNNGYYNNHNNNNNLQGNFYNIHNNEQQNGNHNIYNNSDYEEWDINVNPQDELDEQATVWNWHIPQNDDAVDNIGYIE